MIVMVFCFVARGWFSIFSSFGECSYFKDEFSLISDTFLLLVFDMMYALGPNSFYCTRWLKRQVFRHNLYFCKAFGLKMLTLYLNSISYVMNSKLILWSVSVSSVHKPTICNCKLIHMNLRINWWLIILNS